MHLPFAVRGAVQCEVVDGYDSGVPRDLQIGFDEACPLLNGETKRRHRILGRVPGSAAVRNRPDGFLSHFLFPARRTQHSVNVCHPNRPRRCPWKPSSAAVSRMPFEATPHLKGYGVEIKTGPMRPRKRGSLGQHIRILSKYYL